MFPRMLNNERPVSSWTTSTILCHSQQRYVWLQGESRETRRFDEHNIDTHSQTLDNSRLYDLPDSSRTCIGYGTRPRRWNAVGNLNTARRALARGIIWEPLAWIIR